MAREWSEIDCRGAYRLTNAGCGVEKNVYHVTEQTTTQCLIGSGADAIDRHRICSDGTICDNAQQEIHCHGQ